MTTCSFDGQNLAADTRSMTGGIIDQSPCQKIFRRKGIFCALAGDVSEALVVIKYLLNPKLEKPIIEEGGNWEIILIGGGRTEFYSGTLNPSPMEAPFAIGSGSGYAIAAMLCGKTAAQSIRIAAKLDSSTGVEFGVRNFKIR